ncbi:hypothetical protein [Bradyrhizobium sp. NAS80.1]|uniref:hypothetical protein n=1 Tax=Bradyrhizobium sp. NAS80.1 TaxID=1680159 RepID=UPI001AEF68A1|nr:hypothetical protein [Bradyrhizobium sp. NAS80.1]
MSKNFRRDGDHAKRRQKRAEHVRVAERIDDAELSKHASRQTEIHADRGYMSAAHAAAGADHQFESFEESAEDFDQRVNGLLPIVQNRASANLDHVAEWQHWHHGSVSRRHDLLVEETLAHEHRLDVAAPVDRDLPLFDDLFDHGVYLASGED